MRLIGLMLALLAGAALMGCSAAGPVRSFTVGEEIAYYDFRQSGTFEEGLYANATLRIDGGAYRISLTRGDNELWWGQWGDTLADVVIDVEVEQMSERSENAFGIGCRMRGAVGQDMPLAPELAALLDEAAPEAEAAEEATPEAEATGEAAEEATPEAEATDEAAEEEDLEDEDFIEGAISEVPAGSAADETPNGDGYLFLIQGNGSFAILRARGRDVRPLVGWTQSDAINQGQARNQLRAVCVGDYLAFYINGQFVGDATDTTYNFGQVGLLASAATRLGAVIEFRDLTVYDAVDGGDDAGS
jgi:hypothetical protein